MFRWPAPNRRVLITLLPSVAFLVISFFAILSMARFADAADKAGARRLRPNNPIADFFVADDGNDSWSGTLPAHNSHHTDGPFASIARAQIAMQKLLQSKPNRRITVMIRQGTYSLPLSPTNPGTLNFTSNDSGTPQMPVTWENYPGENPVVSGGEPISALGLKWTNPSGNFWQVHLPTNTQAFEYLFYKKTNSDRRFRSRLQSSKGLGFYMKDGSCYSTYTGKTVDISDCNLGTFLKVAGTVPPGHTGCPSVRYQGQSKCLDRFRYDPSDPIARWANLNGIYTGDPANPCRADGSNPYPAGDIELTLFGSWTVDLMRINCVDTTNHIIYLTGPTQGNPGDYSCFGPAAGHRYVIENAKDAFQQEREAGQTGLWFLDRASVPWTLSYVANDRENPNIDNVAIPQLQPATPTGGSIIAAT